MKISLVVLALTLAVAGASAQSSTPAFEVASIKPNASGSLNANAARVAGDRYRAENVSLQAARGRVEMLVVDRAERPVPD